MSLLIDKKTIQKYDVPGPRYTSYPTAPEWSDEVTPAVYAGKLAAFGQSEKTLSLYIHIPFCESMCYFCACMVAIRKQEEHYGDDYLKSLFREIDLIAGHIGRRKTIRQLHWGGGTPTFLSEGQLQKLFARIASHFDIDFAGEVAIEIDPRRVTRGKLQLLQKLGFNRVSMGIQDFDAKVQETVNRIQPFERVEEVNAWCRELGFLSINFDLIYGLPLQTRESFRDTVAKVIALKPDRIALYSFAYLPWMKKHQTKLDTADLPGTDQKLEIFLEARGMFLNNGYDAIAMDHFALKNDELAVAFRGGTLYRNFMGYTVKPADEYVGAGVSAIGFLEHTYVQNHKTLPEYTKALDSGALPVERGKVLSLDDRARRWTINALICQFEVDKLKFADEFHTDFDRYFQKEQPHIEACVRDRLLEAGERSLKVTELGKFFIRNICMGFDWYLHQADAHKNFSRTV
ncbi:MAG: oxygen-independent coproporphyrinogen III oxidase [Candidatus Omnitrophota bacterium]|nr:oxygen-independent coproporphyrinogen III oxidase [Candidatus Omnitrophota bacterium]MDZ4243174.1 oxygen-independent coproporphyrinogen III oxidase [Candidatus Omnitrophota bacterium]